MGDHPWHRNHQNHGPYQNVGGRNGNNGFRGRRGGGGNSNTRGGNNNGGNNNYGVPRGGGRGAHSRQEQQNGGQPYNLQNNNGGRRSYGNRRQGYENGQWHPDHHQQHPNYQEVYGNGFNRNQAFQANYYNQWNNYIAHKILAPPPPPPPDFANLNPNNHLPINLYNQNPDMEEVNQNNAVNGVDPNEQVDVNQADDGDVQQIPAAAAQPLNAPQDNPINQLANNSSNHHQNQDVGESSNNTTANRDESIEQLDRHQPVDGDVQQVHAPAQPVDFPHHDPNHELPIDPSNRPQDLGMGEKSSHNTENGNEPMKELHDNQAVKLKIEPVQSPEAQQQKTPEARPEEHLSLPIPFGQVELEHKLHFHADQMLLSQNGNQPALNQETCTQEEGIAYFNKNLDIFLSRFELEIVQKKKKDDATVQTDKAEKEIEEREEIPFGQKDNHLLEPIVPIEEPLQNSVKDDVPPAPAANVVQDMKGIVPVEEVLHQELLQNVVKVDDTVQSAPAHAASELSQAINLIDTAEEMDYQESAQNDIPVSSDDRAAPVEPRAEANVPEEEVDDQIMEEDPRAVEADVFIGGTDNGNNDFDDDMGGPSYKNERGVDDSNTPRQDEQEDDMEPLEDEEVPEEAPKKKKAPIKGKSARKKTKRRTHYGQKKTGGGRTRGGAQNAPATSKPNNKRGGKNAKKADLKQSDSVGSSTASAETDSPDRDISPEVNSQGHFATLSQATAPPKPQSNSKSKPMTKAKPKPRIQEDDNTRTTGGMLVADETDTEDDDSNVASTSSTERYNPVDDDPNVASTSSTERYNPEDDDPNVASTSSTKRYYFELNIARGRPSDPNLMDEEEEERMDEDKEELEMENPPLKVRRKRPSPDAKLLKCPTRVSAITAKMKKIMKQIQGECDDEEKKKEQLEKLADQKRQQSFRWDSYKWWLAFSLEYILANLSHFFPSNMFNRSGKPTRITEARIKKIENLIKFILESEDTALLQAQVYLDTVFPDEGNYRHLNEYFKFNTIQHKDAPTDRVARTSPICNLLPRLHLTGALYLPTNSTSKEVLEAGREFLEWNTNLVWEDVVVKAEQIGKPDGKLQEEEAEFFKNSMDKKKPLRMPVPTFHPTSKKDLDSPEFAKMVRNTSMLLVPNFGKTLGIDHSLYTIEQLTSLAPNMVINNIVQSPQSADDNFSQKGERKWHCFGTSDKETDITLAKYKEYYDGSKEHAARVFEALALCNKDETCAVIEKFMEQSIQYQQIKCNDFEKNMFAIRFGTNIDLYDDAFTSQLNELDKLPLVLRPFTARDLLNNLDVDVLGINTVQTYIKTPGSRTPAHVENSVMGSLNWNVGPGTCIWFAVAYEYWGQMDELIKKNGHTWQGQDFWPREQDLIDAGIPYQKFEQKADSMVHVGTGSIHWVQANGYCVNVSWNIGHATFNQIAAAAIEYDNIQQNTLQQHVPLMTAMFNVANGQKYVENKEVVEVIRSMLIRGLGHQKMYFDVLNNLNLLPKKADTYPANCAKCNCEIFNIIKWMKLEEDKFNELEKKFTAKRELNKGKESEEEIQKMREDFDKKYGPKVYCGNCEPDKKDCKGRFVEYTYSWSVDELALILDKYNYRPDATTKSVFPSTLPPRGQKNADQPSTSA